MLNKNRLFQWCLTNFQFTWQIMIFCQLYSCLYLCLYSVLLYLLLTRIHIWNAETLVNITHRGTPFVNGWLALCPTISFKYSQEKQNIFLKPPFEGPREMLQCHWSIMDTCSIRTSKRKMNREVSHTLTRRFPSCDLCQLAKST
jgi:hypothetical protein